MRLVLPIGSSWLYRELDAQRSELVLEGTFEAPDTALTVHHPRPPAASFRAFMEHVMSAGLAPGETVVVENEADVAHDLGWGMRVVFALVSRTERADPVQHRLGAFYRFLGHEAAVLARVRRPERFAERRGDLITLFAKGRPDWNGPELCALADLYR